MHPGDYKVAKILAEKSGGKYTEEEILNALRYSGIKDANGNLIVAEGTQEVLTSNADGNLVNVKSGTTIQDTYQADGTISLRPDKTYPTVLVEDAPNRPGNDLMAYITANTGGTASPYVLTPAASITTTSSLPAAPEGTRRVPIMVDDTTYFPLVANCPAAGCANGSPIATAVQDDATKAYLDAVDRKMEKDFNIATAAAGIAGSAVRVVKAVDDIVSAAVAVNTASKSTSIGGYLSNSTAPEIQQRLSSAVGIVRSEAGLPIGGNVGLAEANIPSISKETLVMKAYSGYDEAIGTFLPKPSGSVDTWVLKPTEATSKYIGGPAAYLRDVDTEFKILETIAQRLGNNTAASGQINLFSEKLVCPSCSSVVNQFRQRYPNIQLNVFTGK